MNYNITKNYVYLFSLSIILSFITSGCLANLSQTSWGLLAGEAPNAVMLQLTPATSESDNSNKVAVCTNGDTQIEEYIKKAILMWAEPIERDKRIKVVGCNESSKVKITTTPTSNPPGGSAAIYPTTGEIVYAPGRGSFPIFLHEIGHAWGLCDQYSGVNNCDDSITGHGNANKNPDSIMGPTYPTNTELKDDDIEGIKYIASLKEIPTNSSWENIAETVEIDSSEDTVSIDLGGVLASTRVRMRMNNGTYIWSNTFHYRPDSSLDASNLRICLANKATCTQYPDSKYASLMIDLVQASDGSYLGTPKYAIKVNYPAKVYLLDVDSSGKLRQYTTFILTKDGATVSSTAE